MKRFLTFLTLYAMLGICNLHAEKKLLVVDYFESEEQNAHLIEEIRNRVVSGIQATNRLNIVDAYSDLSLQVEDYSITRLQLIQNIGARYILIGNIDNVIINKSQLEGGSTYYTAEINITLKFLEASNGEVFAAIPIKTYGGGMLELCVTKEKALNKAISSISGKLERIIHEKFPLKGAIVEVNEVKKNKLISCYVEIGEEHGAATGQEAKVMMVKMVAGRTTFVEIGYLRIEEIVAADMSLCKIMKGQEEIFAALNSGAEVIVETVSKKAHKIEDKARGIEKFLLTN